MEPLKPTNTGVADERDTMVWLLSNGASRITGQVIAVDGGFTTVRPLVK
ncbi:SDR family oxidoreductase [Methylibium sp.]|nr:SDR family oxidoreductase [Methylibium sp.]